MRHPETRPREHDWLLRLRRIAERALGKDAGNRLWQRYRVTFPADYTAAVSPRHALQDLLQLEQLGATRTSVSLLPPRHGHTHYRLHFYSREQRYLDEFIPVLESLHLRTLDQVQFILASAERTFYIRSFTVQAGPAPRAPLAALRKPLLQALQSVMDGKVENDALNKLVVMAGLSWQDIDVLRAYRNYYLQLGLRVSSASVQHALLQNPQVAFELFNYFETRFRPEPAWDQDPSVREEQALFPLRLQLLESIAAVADINDDRILRTFFTLIDATVRCNFHVRRELPDFFVAFKINSLGVIDMPPPKPQYEIYVHAADMQGIHLRAGNISRGGIRWSDRPDDFRTEILGLMRTQISKNALIVPTGAKGGFIVKKNGATQDVQAAGKRAYLTLMRGLLDLTDNYWQGKIVKLRHIVAYDDPDPYLVVAADKGTAKFSDMANAVAAEYRFWLGDAFASGGSRGYDHKALGITARGAWECIKRHFRELGKNIQSEAFTVVGIGSMDGDVFGNAMLLSPGIRLQAAFSGQHIFLDPRPSATGAPLRERKRLFELPGSSWDDYDRTLLSSGGGIYLRTAKEIVLTPEVRQWLGVRYKIVDGETLIRLLLTAPVDLLWLGGIGTYVKATSEKHEDVGDRSNDNVRVDAAALRARVVGEGANLGFTQKARIEYSLKGGRINTDAVDNSAGVDTSDHEVNLKILLSGLRKQQAAADYHGLFTSMTAAVCELVLADNSAQSLCLSLEQLRSTGNAEALLLLAERLEESGFLDRTLEAFPSSKEILTRPGQVITRPELAVLMSAGKRYMTRELEAQPDFLAGECGSGYLAAYFPAPIRAQYRQQLSLHPLAGAITATVISNKVINQAGCGFLMLADANATSGVFDLIGCYLTYDSVLQGDAVRQAIQALDNRVDADKQYQYLLQLENMLAHCCRWTLAQGPKLRPDARTIEQYSRHLHAYAEYFTAQEGHAERLASYHQHGIPVPLAQQLVLIEALKDFPFIVSVSGEMQLDCGNAYKIIDAIGLFLGFPAIQAQLTKLPLHDFWHRKVAADIETGMQRVLAKFLKHRLASEAADNAAYFQLPVVRDRLGCYQRLYRQVQILQPQSLLPFVALIAELERLPL